MSRRGCVWCRGGVGRRVNVRLGSPGGGNAALDGFVCGRMYRSAMSAGSAVGLLWSSRTGARSPCVAGTCLMTSRYGLAVSLGARLCTSSTPMLRRSSLGMRRRGARPGNSARQPGRRPPSWDSSLLFKFANSSGVRAPARRPVDKFILALPSRPLSPLDGHLDAPDVLGTWPGPDRRYRDSWFRYRRQQVLGAVPPPNFPTLHLQVAPEAPLRAPSGGLAGSRSFPVVVRKRSVDAVGG